MMDLDRIEALAKAATPGPWKSRTEVGHPGVVAVAHENAFDWICSMQVANSPRFREDAAFIAAASPDVVLALVRVARAAKEWNEHEWRGYKADEFSPARELQDALAALEKL